MKTCPVCKTTLFDDMDTCYGCMYRFGSNRALEDKLRLEAGDQEAPREDGAQSEVTLRLEHEGASGEDKCMRSDAPAACRQENSDMREWVVRLEVRNRSDPDQTWSVELVPPYAPKPKGGGAMVTADADEEKAKPAAHAASFA